MFDKISINIIGGGATGISCLSQLLRVVKEVSDKEKYEIYLFEKSNVLGKGLAYNNEEKDLLLNSPAGNFSIYPEDQKHFLKWLISFPEKWRKFFPEIKEIDEYSFLPRKLAGLYLEDCVNKAKNLA